MGRAPLVAEYQIQSSPRFDPERFDTRLFDSYVGQRALWSHIALHLVRDLGMSAEFLVSHLGRTRMSLRLRGLVHGSRREEMLSRIAQAEAMLPTGFRWRSVRPDTRFDSMNLRVARVVRRLEFVDLPVPSPDLLPLDKPGETSEDGEGLRRIPSLDTHFQELRTDRFCLPLPGPLDEYKPRVRALFQEIQSSAPLILSMSMHPIEQAEHMQNQMQALGWKRFLDQFAGQLASAGFDNVRSLRSAYDRFSLPPGYLCHCSIRVGGQPDSAVVGLANIVASTLGGFRAFQVHPPSRSIPGIALSDPDLDAPERWKPAQRDAQFSQLRERMVSEGIDVEDAEDALAFMLRVPHLFTLGEAEEILRFPLADDEGLPGFETNPMPPFTVPSLTLHPVSTAEGQVAPPPEARVRLGMVERPGMPLTSVNRPFENAGWHTIDPIDLTKHALIVGGTGSRKTLSTLFLVRELIRLRVPFMVIEPVKTEYFDRLRTVLPALRRRNFEGDAQGRPGRDFLAFDPLRVPLGISVVRHASYLKSCFEAAFPMDPVIALLIEKGLLEYYTRNPREGGCGFAKFARGGPSLGSVRPPVGGGAAKVFPSFDTFKDFLLGPFVEREFSGSAGSAQSKAGEFRDIFRRRFENLALGILGTSFELADKQYRLSAARNGGVPDPRYYDLLSSNFLTRPIVVELDAIPDADQKSLVMAFLMSYIFEFRQAEDLAARETGKQLPVRLRHFLVVEEAHRLLSAGAAGGRQGDLAGQSAQAKSVNLFVDMLAEIRAFGQGLAIVEQIPSKIVPEAIKNTNLKIMLRLPALDDRECLGAAMNFTEAQKRYVTTLKVDRPQPAEDLRGKVNLVLFEEGVEQPLLLSLPLPYEVAAEGSPQSWLFDEFFD